MKARLIALVTLLFCVVYGGADYITAHRTTQLALYLPAELAIPLWPPAILIYDSLYLLFILAPFVLRSDADFRRLAREASVLIVISGVCFLLLPARLGFPAPHVVGPLRATFEASDRLNLTYNLVPSLHVGLAMLCLIEFWPRVTPRVRVALAVWGVALALSTLFTHQHHVLDVIAGAALAWAVCRVPLPALALRRSHAD